MTVPVGLNLLSCVSHRSWFAAERLPVIAAGKGMKHDTLRYWIEGPARSALTSCRHESPTPADLVLWIVHLPKNPKAQHREPHM